MRVCLISREYPPETGWGGIATFTRHLALGLREIGHDVEVICLAKDQAKTVEQEGILVHRVVPFFGIEELGLLGTFMPYSRYVIGTAPALWLKFLERHTERAFDVVDAPELLADGVFTAVTRVAPLIIRLYTPHSKFIAERFHNISAGFDHQLVAATERIAMVQADALTSPSLDLAKFVANDINYPLERIKIIGNPIDTDEFSPNGDEAKIQGIARDDLTVLFVGRLEERKGIKFLIEAIPSVCRAISNVRFLIIGEEAKVDGQSSSKSSSKSLVGELKATLENAGCINKVFFHGRVPLEQLPLYYRTADVCVVPSAYDNSPYSCLEAMSCGTPVIGTDAGGTKEYVEHGVSGLVVPALSATALSQALITILSDHARRKEMGMQARQRVLQSFKRTEVSRQTAELYEDARLSFSARLGNSSLYRREPEHAADDLRQMCLAMDYSIHEILYKTSYQYRLKHWKRFAKQRPGLFAAKVGRKFARGIGGKHLIPKQMAWLDTLIEKKGMPENHS